MNEKPLGYSIPALVRELLVNRGWTLQDATDFSREVDQHLVGADWLELYNGTTFDLAYTPGKTA